MTDHNQMIYYAFNELCKIPHEPAHVGDYIIIRPFNDVDHVLRRPEWIKENMSEHIITEPYNYDGYVTEQIILNEQPESILNEILLTYS